MMNTDALHEAFPAATIVRPASMFGDEDRFLNRIALMGGSFPFIPMVDGGASKQQPVYVDDAAAYVPERLFITSTPGAGGLPDVLFWKVLSFWRSSRDDDDYVPPRPDDY